MARDECPEAFCLRCVGQGLRRDELGRLRTNMVIDQQVRLVRIFGCVDRCLRQQELGVIVVAADDSVVAADDSTDVRIAPAVGAEPERGPT